MAHCIDAYSPSPKRIPREIYEARLRARAPQGRALRNFEYEDGNAQFVALTGADDDSFCRTIDYSACVHDPENGDVAWIRRDIKECEPASAVRRLHDWAPNARVMHRIRLLAGHGDEELGLQVVDEMIKTAHREAGGIIRADYEGYTNEQGHHILWQFADDVTGPLDAAVLDENGQRQSFVMDLENLEHRAAFKAGRIPPGARPVGSR